jgi:HAMP domain-containing protein
MAEPTRYRKVDRALSRASFLTNIFGALFVLLYFQLAADGPRQPTAGQGWQLPLLAAVTLAGLVVLGSFVSDAYLKPMLRWYKAASQAAAPGPAPEPVRALVLRVPWVAALVSQGMWALAGVVFGWYAGWDAQAGQFKGGPFLMVFLGSLTAGLLVSILMYMATENIWRAELPLFLAGQPLQAMPRRFKEQARQGRLSVRGRMLLVSLVNTGLMIFMAYISYTRAAALAATAEPGPLLWRMLGLQALLVISGVLVLVQLGRNMAATIVHPLERLSDQVRRIGQGDLGARTVVETSDELGLLGDSLNQMAASLQLREAELQALNQIGRELVANLELDPLLQAVLAQVRGVIPCEAAEVCLYDGNAARLQPQARLGEAQAEAPGFKLGESWTGQVGQQRRTLRSHSGQPDLPTDAPQMGGLAWASYLGVPLLAGARLVGTLALGSREAGAFDAHEQMVLETIAPQAAIAIANAAEVQERERSLKAKIKSLEIEVDEARRTQQVAEITDTEFFQSLEGRAAQMRAKRRA